MPTQRYTRYFDNGGGAARPRITMSGQNSAGTLERHAQKLQGAILLVLFVSSRISLADDPKLNAPPQKEAPTAFAAPEPSPVRDWGVGEGKSYLVPAWEIPAFELLLNRVDSDSASHV